MPCADIHAHADGWRIPMIDFMKLEAVIWDMDGVLLDSGPSHFKAWHTTLKKHKMKVLFYIKSIVKRLMMVYMS